MESSPLEIKFSTELFKRSLEENPEQAQELALTYFELFSTLVIKHEKLEQNFQVAQFQLAQLQNSKVRKPLQLPSFLKHL